MFKVFVASCIAATACGQALDAKNAKIPGWGQYVCLLTKSPETCFFVHTQTHRRQAQCSTFVFVAPAVQQPELKTMKKQRFDAGDGRFGAAFAQEDGTVFREETTSDGERIGQYSYIDQNGKTITVRYSAGKDGFRILEGAHVPEGATGLQSAAFDPAIAEAGAQDLPQQSAAPRQQQFQPQQSATPRQQQFQPQQPTAPRQQQFQPQQQQQLRPAPVQQQQPAADFNPFINPADPTHRDFQRNVNAAQFRPQPQQARIAPRQQSRAQPQPQQTISNPVSVPACANCEGINPFINPADSSHTQLFTSQPAAPAFRQQQPQTFRQPASTFAPQQQQPKAVNPAFTFQQRTQTQQQPLQPAFAAQQPQEQARPSFRAPQQAPPSFRQPQNSAPASLNNFQGNLNLNRFDTGFNFEFSS